MLAEATNPIVRWEYLVDEWDRIETALVQHVQLTLLAVGLGLLVAAALSAVALRFRWTASPITTFTAFVYTIPSVALFGLLVPYTGVSTTTAVIPLVGYTLLVLVTSILTGFRSVPAAVRDAADGMGLSPARRVLTVELPLAVPYIVTGIRVATVTTVGLVTVAAIIGEGGLGRLILDGLRRTFWTPMTVGAALSITLALVLDLAIWGIGRALTPWARPAPPHPRPHPRPHRTAPGGGQMTATAAAVPAAQAVRRDIGLFDWLLDAGTWTGDHGILSAAGDTVRLCAAVVVTAALLAVPLGALLAHVRRGELATTWIVNVGRAVPTFALAGLLVPISLRWGLGFEPWPVFIALTLLALPPIFLTTFTAVSQVDPVVVDAARGMGFDERRVLLKVEVALALSVVVTGVRVAAVQVVATEPIRAFLGGGGLGGYLRDGLGQNNDTLVLGGAILVAGLAAATGAAFGVLERIVLPRGVRRLRNVGDRRPGSPTMGGNHEQALVQTARDGAADLVGGVQPARRGVR